jgi:hypothetical protein
MEIEKTTDNEKIISDFIAEKIKKEMDERRSKNILDIDWIK